MKVHGLFKEEYHFHSSSRSSQTNYTPAYKGIPENKLLTRLYPRHFYSNATIDEYDSFYYEQKKLNRWSATADDDEFTERDVIYI